MRKNLQEMAELSGEEFPSFIAAAVTMFSNGELRMELESLCNCSKIMHVQVFGIGFPWLPITCPHCHRIHKSYDNMRFSVMVDKVVT